MRSVEGRQHSANGKGPQKEGLLVPEVADSSPQLEPTHLHKESLTPSLSKDVGSRPPPVDGQQPSDNGKGH